MDSYETPTDTRDQLIELIFTKCTLVYGRDFLDRWAGQDIDEVKADWMRELGGFMNFPHRIRHGLEHLPQRPPTALHFREICREAPDSRPRQARLTDEPPPANPKRVAAIVSHLTAKLKKRDRLQWARDLEAREIRGDDLSIWQQRAWRNALTQAPAENMTFSNIDPACLPPGMRPREQNEAFARAESQALEQFYGQEQQG